MAQCCAVVQVLTEISAVPRIQHSSDEDWPHTMDFRTLIGQFDDKLSI